MKLTSHEITQIRESFYAVKTREDMLALINVIQSYLYPKNKPIRIRSLNYYAHPKLSSTKRYAVYTITKKNGKERIIHAPIEGLKLIQECLNCIFSILFLPNINVMGYVKGKSIVDNARIHFSKHYIYNTDLQNFFSYIQLHRVKTVLKLPPFCLDGDREPLAFWLANLCCVEGVLPQGAPTSPILSNVICQNLDRRLNGIAKRFGAAYTRYADDITFSSFKNVFQQEFEAELEKVITAQGFKINIAKTRLQKGGYKQIVTGLTVNEKVNVSQKFIKEIRAMLHNWQKLGLPAATEKFLEKYKHLPKEKQPYFKKVVKGRVDFLGMVRGKNDGVYQKYLNQFIQLNPIAPLKEKAIQFHTQQNVKKEVKQLNTTAPLAQQNSKKEAKSYHAPLDTSHFLQLFRNSKGLKFLSHKFDVVNELFNADEIVKIAKQEFKENTEERYKIPRSLWMRIDYFAFKNQEEKGIAFPVFWKRADVVEWCKHNPSMHPIQNPVFAKEIEDFKNSIEIRAPKLEELMINLLKKIVDDKYTDIQLILQDVRTANFYTDVERFTTGLSAIFCSIKERIKPGDKLAFTFKRQVDGILIKRAIHILHYNSKASKSSEDIYEGSGDFNNAKKAFRGICDWYVEGVFTDGCARIGMLRKENIGEAINKDIDKESVLGFKHILIFYS